MDTNLPIYKLTISEDLDSKVEVDAVALVDMPAIGEGFFAFNEHQFETYNDCPKAAMENAKTALRWAEENGWGSCGTAVGKQRANQLANGENISRDTIALLPALKVWVVFCFHLSVSHFLSFFLEQFLFCVVHLYANSLSTFHPTYPFPPLS